MAGFPEGKLTDEAKAFVVCALARFDAPTSVAGAVKAEFGIQVSPQAIQAYDPTKHQGKRLADKWVALFDTTRKAFLENIATIPIANRAVRLHRMDRMSAVAETKGNIPLAIQIIVEAAKECGDIHVNRNRPNDGPDNVVTIHGGLPD